MVGRSSARIRHPPNHQRRAVVAAPYFACYPYKKRNKLWKHVLSIKRRIGVGGKL